MTSRKSPVPDLAAEDLPTAPVPLTTSPEETQLTTLYGWGRFPVAQAHERRAENLEEITAGAVLTRGLGRSYGDSSLPPAGAAVVAASPLADRLLAFDTDTGLVDAEAGLSLLRLNHVSLPRGWFTPVTPGTQYVTLGGMVAADVHGKNHHVDGCFGAHVRRLRMRVADGRILECSDDHEPDLFRATLAGMGLTGHILEVQFRMKKIPSPWIWAESERFADLDGLIDGLKRSSQVWPYTVCWIDCLSTGARLGQGIVMRGRWAEPSEARDGFALRRTALSVPFLLPDWVLQPGAVKAFNAWYHWWHGGHIHRGIVHPQAFFYPLDVVGEWNRLYGSRGFTQYQCVLPAAGPDPSLHKLLQRIAEHGGTPYLGVVKDCGPEGKGMLSFPRPGISFALDMPIRGPDTQRLIDALNELVIAAGGRIYLAKDAFTRAEHYRAMDARLDAWNTIRRAWDPHAKLRSAQSVRVLGDPR
jgi:decaprenylphospho-beta-D-ribofuranose 2-oxidase